MFCNYEMTKTNTNMIGYTSGTNHRMYWEKSWTYLDIVWSYAFEICSVIIYKVLMKFMPRGVILLSILPFPFPPLQPAFPAELRGGFGPGHPLSQLRASRHHAAAAFLLHFATEGRESLQWCLEANRGHWNDWLRYYTTSPNKRLACLQLNFSLGIPTKWAVNKVGSIWETHFRASTTR